jgi:hypothetical protein
MILDHSWLSHLEESVPLFLRSLKPAALPGRFLPCKRGATPVGREMALGWSCFALKTLHILGQWELLSREHREGWVEFIQDFQKTDGEGAFEDPPQMAALQRSPSLIGKLLRLIGRGPWRPEPRSILLAETKQAIATLADAEAAPRRPFRGFPVTPEHVREWLNAQDWSKPWGAGGQSAGLVVFIKTQAPMFMDPFKVDALLAVCRDFYASLADPETGAYFRGSTPAHGELINGAMKVLMALDWLEVPIHHPERLAATVLAKPPEPSGCHLVDAIYVLHRALAAPGESRADSRVRGYCTQVQELIRAHANEDGGLSFHVRKAQTAYYGVEVSRGLDESDVQGTCLLVWALAMIWRLLEPESARWKLIRP